MSVWWFLSGWEAVAGLILWQQHMLFLSISLILFLHPELQLEDDCPHTLLLWRRRCHRLVWPRRRKEDVGTRWAHHVLQDKQIHQWQAFPPFLLVTRVTSVEGCDWLSEAAVTTPAPFRKVSERSWKIIKRWPHNSQVAVAQYKHKEDTGPEGQFSFKVKLYLESFVKVPTCSQMLFKPFLLIAGCVCVTVQMSYIS